MAYKARPCQTGNKHWQHLMNITMATGLGGLDSRLVRLGARGQMPLTAQERRQWLKSQQQNLNSFWKAKSSAIFGKIH